MISSENACSLTPFLTSRCSAARFLKSYLAIMSMFASYDAASIAAWYSFGSFSHSLMLT